MKVVKGYFKCMDAIYNVCKVMGLALLAATVTLLFVATVLRYCFNITLSWAEELCRYMVIWFSLLGSGIGIRNNIHVGFDLIKTKLPEKIKPFWNVMLNLLALAGSSMLVSIAVKLVKQVSKQTSSSMGIPMSYVYMGLLVGLVLIALFSLEAIVKEVTKKK